MVRWILAMVPFERIAMRRAGQGAGRRLHRIEVKPLIEHILAAKA